MSRLIFWLGLVFLVMFAIRSKLRDMQQRNNPQQRPQQPGPAPAPGSSFQRRSQSAEVETMLCCAHCGVYYPASENVAAGGRDYCSAAHAGLPAA